MRSARDFEIIDIHQHCGGADAMFGPGKAFTAEDDVRIRTGNMDRHGIDRAILLPSSMDRDIVAANDFTAACRDLLPDRFPACLGTVDPTDRGAPAEMDRCLGKLGMKGMAWHHRFNGVVLDHPGMKPLLARLQEAKLPAFIHIIAGSTLESPWRLENLADDFPDVTFVALDAFSSSDQAMWMPRIARTHPNMLFDTGVMTSVGHGLSRFVKRYGANRLLLGTDCYSEPAYHTPFPVTELLASPLADADLRLIFAGNIRRLLGLGDGAPKAEFQSAESANEHSAGDSDR